MHRHDIGATMGLSMINECDFIETDVIIHKHPHKKTNSIFLNKPICSIYFFVFRPRIFTMPNFQDSRVHHLPNLETLFKKIYNNLLRRQEY